MIRLFDINNTTQTTSIVKKIMHGQQFAFPTGWLFGGKATLHETRPPQTFCCETIADSWRMILTDSETESNKKVKSGIRNKGAWRARRGISHLRTSMYRLYSGYSELG